MVSLSRAGRLPAGLARQMATNDISISFATVGELWKWSLTRRWGVARRGGLDLWLDGTAILPAGLQVAKVWGEIATRAQRRGQPRPLNDAWTAACVEGGLPLLTLNHRDFADLAEHDRLVLLGG